MDLQPHRRSVFVHLLLLLGLCALVAGAILTPRPSSRETAPIGYTTRPSRCTRHAYQPPRAVCARNVTDPAAQIQTSHGGPNATRNDRRSAARLTRVRIVRPPSQPSVPKLHRSPAARSAARGGARPLDVPSRRAPGALGRPSRALLRRKRTGEPSARCDKTACPTPSCASAWQTASDWSRASRSRKSRAVSTPRRSRCSAGSDSSQRRPRPTGAGDATRDAS